MVPQFLSFVHTPNILGLCSWVAEKLNDHRLKPGGVLRMFVQLGSSKVEVQPAKAWWCLVVLPSLMGYHTQTLTTPNRQPIAQEARYTSLGTNSKETTTRTDLTWSLGTRFQ